MGHGRISGSRRRGNRRPGRAIGLSRVGWQVAVFERLPGEPDDAGPGIPLAANGVRALDALGAGDALRGAGRFQRTVSTRSPRGTWLARMDGAELERVAGTPIVGIARYELHRLLRSLLPSTVVRDEVTAEPIALSFSDSSLTWGRGVEFGHIVLADGRAEWHAGSRLGQGACRALEDAVSLLMRRRQPTSTSRSPDTTRNSARAPKPSPEPPGKPAVRDLALRAMPTTAMARSMLRYPRWQPPTLANRG